MADETQPTPQTESDQPILVWEAKEFAEYERSRSWYVYALIAGAIGVAVMIFLQQWLGAVVFGLATFVVVRHAGDQPRTLTYSITNLGVHAGNRFVPYSELKLYWIVYNPPAKTLNLQSTNRFKPLLKIHLEDIDPLAVRNALQNHLPEEPKATEDFLDKFSRFIRL